MYDNTWTRFKWRNNGKLEKDSLGLVSLKILKHSSHQKKHVSGFLMKCYQKRCTSKRLSSSMSLQLRHAVYKTKYDKATAFFLKTNWPALRRPGFYYVLFAVNSNTIRKNQKGKVDKLNKKVRPQGKYRRPHIAPRLEERSCWHLSTHISW